MAVLQLEKIWWNYRLHETVTKCMVFIYFHFVFLLLLAFQLDFYEVISCNPSVGQQNPENRIQALIMKTTAITTTQSDTQLRTFSVWGNSASWAFLGIFRVCIAYFTSCQSFYQGHVTEAAAENCPQNFRNWNIHCKHVVTFNCLLQYIRCQKRDKDF